MSKKKQSTTMKHFLVATVGEKVREAESGGMPHLVVPVIAAKEMVMNQYFYPADALEESVSLWEGKPVSMGHPSINGVWTSANQPWAEDRLNIGKFFNIKFEDNKLKGEIWVDIGKAERLGFSNVVERLRNEEVIEVSTGLVSDVESHSGVFDKTSFIGIIRNIAPDHLAILENDIGACSMKDGCGTTRVNCENNEKCGCNPVSNNAEALKEKIRNYLNFLGEKLGVSNVIISEEKEEVVKVTEFNPVINKDDKGESNMSDDEKKVDADTPAEETPPVAPEAPAPPVADVPATEEEKKEPITLNQKVDAVIANADADTKEYLQVSVNEHRKKKEALVSSLKTNSEFSEDELKVMPYSMLEKLSNSIKKAAPPDYSGKGGGHINKDMYYEVPRIVTREVTRKGDK